MRSSSSIMTILDIGGAAQTGRKRAHGFILGAGGFARISAGYGCNGRGGLFTRRGPCQLVLLPGKTIARARPLTIPAGDDVPAVPQHVAHDLPAHASRAPAQPRPTRKRAP